MNHLVQMMKPYINNGNRCKVVITERSRLDDIIDLYDLDTTFQKLSEWMFSNFQAKHIMIKTGKEYKVIPNPRVLQKYLRLHSEYFNNGLYLIVSETNIYTPHIRIYQTNFPTSQHNFKNRFIERKSIYKKELINADPQKFDLLEESEE